MKSRSQHGIQIDYILRPRAEIALIAPQPQPQTQPEKREKAQKWPLSIRVLAVLLVIAIAPKALWTIAATSAAIFWWW